MKLLKNIWIAINAWSIANLTSCEVWYAVYPDGRKTRRLGHREAKSCKDIWGGKLYVDWKYAKELAAL